MKAGESSAPAHLGPVVQVGIIVRDIETTIQQWQRLLDYGPIKVVDWPLDPADTTGTYHGQPGNFRMRLAFIETGSVQIELIQPLSGQNIYSDFLESRGEGLHHLLFTVDNPEAVAAGMGVQILQSGSSTIRPGAIWAYLDTQDLLKCIIELRGLPGGSV